MKNLSDAGVIREIMTRHKFDFSKSLGQNFLINPSVCPRMAQLCAEQNDECVIEIGAGIGVLTCELAQRFEKVVSFELDKRLLPVLNETLSEFDNIEIINADVLKTDLSSLIAEKFGGKKVSVCANLPYYITSPVIMYLLESRLPLSNITVMVQKEAADRLCAEIGSREAGAVTAAVSYYAESEKLFDVSKGSFMPSPKVDSTVIHLTVRSTPPVTTQDEAFFFRVIKASFEQRRKTALNSLSAGLSLPKDTILHALTAAGFDANIRAERFTLVDFSKISSEIKKFIP